MRVLVGPDIVLIPAGNGEVGAHHCGALEGVFVVEVVAAKALKASDETVGKARKVMRSIIGSALYVECLSETRRWRRGWSDGM